MKIRCPQCKGAAELSPGFVSVKCDSCDFDMGYGEYVRYVAHRNSTYSDILGDYAKGAKGQSPGTLDEWD